MHFILPYVYFALNYAIPSLQCKSNVNQHNVNQKAILTTAAII